MKVPGKGLTEVPQSGFRMARCPVRVLRGALQVLLRCQVL